MYTRTSKCMTREAPRSSWLCTIVLYSYKTCIYKHMSKCIACRGPKSHGMWYSCICIKAGSIKTQVISSLERGLGSCIMRQGCICNESCIYNCASICIEFVLTWACITLRGPDVSCSGSALQLVSITTQEHATCKPVRKFTSLSSLEFSNTQEIFWDIFTHENNNKPHLSIMCEEIFVPA
jgi:hypothetical protein